jgi:ABC-type ATPase involved in cell division
MDYLTELYQSGQAILLITHDDRLVCRYAQRIIRLTEGRILSIDRQSQPAPLDRRQDLIFST